ncbi:MAG: hypothetical protein PHV74_01815 [Dehalococcoidia bacterium]|nr:hypothetical protein [Dehalococcoidia bacterium]
MSSREKTLSCVAVDASVEYIIPDFLSAKKACNASFKDMIETAKAVRRINASLFKYLDGMVPSRKTFAGHDLEIRPKTPEAQEISSRARYDFQPKNSSKQTFRPRL